MTNLSLFEILYLTNHTNITLTEKEMEKHIELLENWLKKQIALYAEKYSAIDLDECPTEDTEKIRHNSAAMLDDKIRTWSRKLKKEAFRPTCFRHGTIRNRRTVGRPGRKASVFSTICQTI